MAYHIIISIVPCTFFACSACDTSTNVKLYLSESRGPQGAWQRFERGELPLFTFYEAFGRDLSDTVNGNIWYKSYCKRKGIGKGL